MSKLRESAKGQHCMVRLPGVCNGNPETTVLAHLNGGGMGMKQSDLLGAFACSACHDAVDGRVDHRIPRQDLDCWHMRGACSSKLKVALSCANMIKHEQDDANFRSRQGSRCRAEHLATVGT